MTSENEFRCYYENEIENIADKYELSVKKVNLKCLLMGIMVFIISISLYLAFDNVLTFIILLLLLIVLKDSKTNLNRISNEYKYDVTSKIVAFLSGNKNAGINEKMQISRKSIQECELFNTDKLASTGSNYTIMMYNKFNIVLSDLLLLYYDNKNRTKDIFNGVYFSATFNKPIREQTYIIPNNMKDIIINNAMNYYNYLGTRVVLENNEFEKKYNVYSANEVQARYIISLRLMERINDIDKIFPGKKHVVFKDTGKISILFSDESIKNKLLGHVNLLDSESRFKFCKEIFDYFRKFLEVYEILDLENRLYMMEV